MSTPLSNISVDRRRHIAATLGLFSMLFIAVGAVASTGVRTTVVTAFVVVAFLIALLLALIAWGVLHSIGLDRTSAEAGRVDPRIESAIEQALAAQGGSLAGCGCGHDHDPDELRVTDDPCGRDGAGHECSHTCETCVFSRLRSVPASAALDSTARASVGSASRRPSPRPRPVAARPLPSRVGVRD